VLLVSVAVAVVLQVPAVLLELQLMAVAAVPAEPLASTL
jgi:hypothetical protein